jgi:hypothetical protein
VSPVGLFSSHGAAEKGSMSGREGAMTMDAEEGTRGTSAVDEREVLERFVVENDDLLTLESRIGRFNIFDALRITDAEIRHSNFLAFLVDPGESHGQGQLFLKAILMDLFRQSRLEKRPQGCSPIVLDATELRGVDVKREWKHTDLLITCNEPPFVVVIENKIRATEGSDQLSRYEEAMEKHHPGALFVYLTLKAEPASRDAWMPYGYEDIYRVLKRLRNANQKSIGGEVLVFLDHYLNLIETRFMNDKKIDELCRAIYKKHRQALDLIWEHVGNPISGVMADAVSVLDRDPRWSVIAKRGGSLDFMPTAWLEWLPPFGPKGDKQWIMLRAWREEGRLAYTLGVVEMVDAAKRKEIVTKLLEAWTGFGFNRSKASEIKAKWSNISSADSILEWKEDSEPDAEAIHREMKNKLDELFPKLEKLEPVLKSLCELPSAAT